MRELMQRMLREIRRKRVIFNIPFWIARMKASVFEFLGTVTLGIAPVPFTRDQVINLGRDNVVGEGARTLANLGIEATAMDAVLDEYLWRFRPSGQYAEITKSAKKLRVSDG